jgi:hypothetical protein
MGYGVRNDREAVSDMMRGANTVDEAGEKDKHEVVLNDEQMMKKICDDRL